jgi:hypothetical protein
MENKSSATEAVSPELYALVSELITATGQVLEKRNLGDVDARTELSFLAFTIGSIIGIAIREDQREETIRQLEDTIRAGILSTRDHCLDNITLN